MSLATLTRPAVIATHARGPQRKWTDAERAELRRRYDSTHQTTDALAVQFGRSFNAVKQEAVALGITRPGHTRIPWTPEDDATLRRLAEQYSLIWAARKMRRSVASVRNRASTLSIRSGVERSWFTLSEVSTLLGTDHKVVERWRTEGWLPGTKDQGVMWRFEASDVKRFIRSHAGSLVGRNLDFVGIVELLVGTA